jgi:hypothetical protein
VLIAAEVRAFREQPRFAVMGTLNATRGLNLSNLQKVTAIQLEYPAGNRVSRMRYRRRSAPPKLFF